MALLSRLVAVTAAGVSALLLISVAGAASSAAGDRDLKFGTGGLYHWSDPVAAEAEATSVVVQPDGKLVVAGYADLGSHRVVRMIRLTPAGRPDPTFGFVNELGRNDGLVSGLAVQSSGTIVATGTWDGPSNPLFGVLRVNPDGSRAQPGSNRGWRTIPTPGVWSAQAAAGAIQRDGAILVAGSGANEVRDGVEHRIFVLARLRSDGSIDRSFGAAASNGVVYTNFADSSQEAAHAVAVAPDGKIVLAGLVDDGRARFALARYLTDGRLDPSFDGDGKVVTDFLSSKDEGARAVAVQPDGKIVAAGYAIAPRRGGTNFWIAVARYRPNGSLDPSFDGDGKVLTRVRGGAKATALALQPDGKIVVVGTARVGVGDRFALVRYRPDGQLDTAFSSDGTHSDIAGGTEARDGARATGIALQPDGRIVVVGSASRVPGTTKRGFAVVRYQG